MSALAQILASFFGAGYSKIAPGTVGAFLGAVLVYLSYVYLDLDVLYTIPALALLSYVVGILAINRLPNTWKQDDGRIVIDEAHGIFITLSFVPFSLENLIIGFILFRFFDILKPLGIKKLDQLHNTHGVMLDDTLAGVYANIVLQVIVRWVIV